MSEQSEIRLASEELAQEPRASAVSRLESAVFALDRWLRKRQGIYEYTANPRCLFRLQRARADCSVVLADRTRVRKGDPILMLHLWNEHIPPMGRQGPTLAWARQAITALDLSLYELARYCGRQRDLDDVTSIWGDMRVGSIAQSAQISRIVERYGFEEIASGTEVDGRGLLHRIGDGLLILMLVLATNPAALRSSFLRYFNKRVILSRAVLESRGGQIRFRDRTGYADCGRRILN